MTKEITKARIMQEIEDKFKLREFLPESFLFSELVVPVYDLESHLQSSEQTFVERGIAALGPVSFFEVPENERWLLRLYDVVLMAAGAYTVAGVYIQRKKRNPVASYVYLDLTAAQTVSYHIDLMQPILLDPGDYVYINIDGYTSPANLRLYIDYIKEEIR